MKGIPLFFFAMSVISAILAVTSFFAGTQAAPQAFMAVMFALWAIAARQERAE